MPQGGKPAVFELVLAQNFQMLSGSASVDGRALTLENPHLSGDQLSLALIDAASATRYEYSGRISGHAINGTLRVAGAAAQRQLEWEAARTELGTPAHTLLKKPTMQELQEKMLP
jgi:hypothetical protein